MTPGLPPSMVQLPRWQKSALHAISALTFLSGIVWMALHYSENHWIIDVTAMPYERLSMKLHGAGAVLALMALGSLLPVHAKWGLKSKKNRLAGILLMTVALSLILTGYALYYAEDHLREQASQIHLVIGSLSCILFLFHVNRRRTKSPLIVRN